MNHSKNIFFQCKEVDFLVIGLIYDCIGLRIFFVVKSRPNPNRFFYVFHTETFLLTVQKFQFFEILYLDELAKNVKNVSITSKMEMFTKIIA